MIRGTALRRLRWPVSLRFCRQQSNDSSLLPRAREKLVSLGEGRVSLVKDDSSGIATIKLHQEHRKNALSGRMMVQLWDITKELQDWGAGKAVILCGEGDAFCSGGDLVTMQSIRNPNDGLLMATLMHDAVLRLYCLPFVTVCLVHGKAIGAGAELTTATDYRVFTETGEVSFVQGKLGLVTGVGGGTLLVKMLGSSLALNILLSCKKLNGTKAMQIGLADHIVDSKTRQEELNTWLSGLISHETEVVQALKRIAVGARDSPLNDSMLNERHNFAPLWGGPANLKALEKLMKHN